MDIQVIGIRNAGESNERLLIRVLNNCSLKGYMVIDNTYEDNGQLSNTNRHIYIFPEWPVKKGDIVRLYTKRGKNNGPQIGTFGSVATAYHNFYWGFSGDDTVWNKNGDTAYIVHYDNVEPQNMI